MRIQELLNSSPMPIRRLSTLPDPSHAISATTSSNHSSFPVSPAIPTQPPSTSPILPQAYDVVSPKQPTANRSEISEGDAKEDEDLAVPHSEISRTDLNCDLTSIIAPPTYTPPHLLGGREPSLFLQSFSPLQSPSRSSFSEQRIQTLTGLSSDIPLGDQIEASPRLGADEHPDLDLDRTRKRLRSQTGQGITISEKRNEIPDQAPLILSEIGIARKRKTARRSSLKNTWWRAEDDPVHHMACQIGHPDRVGEMRQMISDMQSGMNRSLALVEPNLRAGIVPCEAESIRLFQGVSTFARQIEATAACERLFFL